MGARVEPQRPPIADAAVERVVDGVLGIVRTLRDASVEPNCPDIFVCGAQAANTSVYFPGPCNAQNSGAGLTPREARLSAVGETVERYCSASYDRDELRFGSWRSLEGAPALGPDAFALFHPSQAEALGRYSAFDADTPLAWMEGFSLTHRVRAWLPATQVFLPYHPAGAEKGDAPIGPAYSSGLSAGSNPVEALYHGLCELIERDAFMAMWMNRLPLPEVDLRGDPELSRLYDEVFARDGLEYRLLDATTDVGVPAIFCLIVDHAFSPPLACIGGSARLSASAAATKAMLEAAHTCQWARTLRSDRRYRDDFADVRGFDDHVALHASGQVLDSLDFLRRGDPGRDVTELPEIAVHSFAEGTRWIVDRLRALGMEAFAADLTTPDVAEVGFHVARAMVPGLIPLHAGHAVRPLGHPRLYDVARRMGYDTRTRTLEDMNPVPHPFP